MQNIENYFKGVGEQKKGKSKMSPATNKNASPWRGMQIRSDAKLSP